MTKSFYIGNVEFCLEAPIAIIFSVDIEKYTLKHFPITRKVTYHIRFLENPEPIQINFLTSVPQPPQIIGNTNTGECRIYQDIFTQKPISCYQEKGDSEVSLSFYSQIPNHILVDLNTVNYMAIERHLLLSGAAILHSSFIKVENEAILFTAPSGTGKSTQADLWSTFRDAKIRNGDRSLLIKHQNQWFASGFPFSGSSNINKNETYPVKAIVMIQQACHDIANTSTHIVAFKRIYPEITRNYWNLEYENKVHQILEDLIPSIQTIELGCTMSENAVKCLENTLYMGENNYEIYSK